MSDETNIPQLDHDENGKAGGSLPASERGLDDLRAEAESLGVKVNQRWGAPRLQQEIDAALAKPAEPPREKTLHELNLEQWRSNRENSDLNLKAGEAAKVAVVETLAEKRPDGKRTRKDLRPVAE
jgi:hypothetical protein